MVDKNEATIDDAESDLDGKQLNYWTSLCYDKLNGSSFKESQWQTRVRVTASIKLDQRLTMAALPSAANGSPFIQAQLYDFSKNYFLKKRTATSAFYGTSFDAEEADDATDFADQITRIRRQNEDMSISAAFTLERLWLGDGSGQPDFTVGDMVERISGREYQLAASLYGLTVYPEIIKIIYLPETQKQKIITRDLRFAEVNLWNQPK